MHTQNVKTAAHESSERWGENRPLRLARVIAEQKSYLNELCGLWNMQLTEIDEAEEIYNIVCAMSKNVLEEGVIDWDREKPLVSLYVVQPWLEAKAHAVRLYGETGAMAWEHSRKEFEDGIIFSRALMQIEFN